jgi:hypothetical protein
MRGAASSAPTTNNVERVKEFRQSGDSSRPTRGMERSGRSRATWRAHRLQGTQGLEARVQLNRYGTSELVP